MALEDCIDGNDVYAFDVDEEVLYLRFGVGPGENWESGYEAGTYLRIGKIIGLETVKTPTGTFDNCVHSLSKITYSDDSFESYDLWYARNIGLVMSEKTEQYRGEIIDSTIHEVLSYEIR